MRWNNNRFIFAVVFAGFLITPPSVWSMPVNDFYRCFLQNLKASRYPQLKELVRKNQEAAQESLVILRQKIQDEKDSPRKEAYHLIVQDLEELVSVAAGIKDCTISSRIASRGQETALAEDAVEAFRRAVHLCPENLDAFIGLAESNKRLGKFDEAMDGYEKVLAMKEDSADALLAMGEILYSAGLYERSVPYLERVLSTESENKKARVLLASSTRQIALDADGILRSDEIVDRLRAPLDGDLMCMCPQHAALIARIRFRSITFSTGSTRLDAPARAQLAELALALKTETLKGGRYLIEGHADPLGAKDYNTALSGRRAEAVRRYLVDVLKVNPSIITAVGVGASRSWTTNETHSGRRANRRIEVISLGSTPS